MQLMQRKARSQDWTCSWLPSKRIASREAREKVLCTCMSVALSGPFLSMLSANSSAFFSVVSNWSLQRESHTVSG